MSHVDQVPIEIGYYFAGFVDGEGSFHLVFRRRADYQLPWKVSLSLNVSQKDKPVLALLKRHLGCGSIRSKSDGVWMFEVSNLNAIRDNVIPFFRRFGFLSAKKKRDFAIFQRMADLMQQRAHLSREGIEQLLQLRTTMNDGGKRKFSDRQILEAFDTRPAPSPGALTPGATGGSMESSETTCQTSSANAAEEDDIVRSAWRHAEPSRNVSARPRDQASPERADE